MNHVRAPAARPYFVPTSLRWFFATFPFWRSSISLVSEPRCHTLLPPLIPSYPPTPTTLNPLFFLHVYHVGRTPFGCDMTPATYPFHVVGPEPYRRRVFFLFSFRFLSSVSLIDAKKTDKSP